MFFYGRIPLMQWQVKLVVELAKDEKKLMVFNSMLNIMLVSCYGAWALFKKNNLGLGNLVLHYSYK